jgi:hypothetical protein
MSNEDRSGPVSAGGEDQTADAATRRKCSAIGASDPLLLAPLPLASVPANAKDHARRSRPLTVASAIAYCACGIELPRRRATDVVSRRSDQWPRTLSIC